MDEIVNSLHKLKLPGMADCWTSLSETHRLDKLSLREGLQLLLQTERDTRQSNRVTRLIKEARFSYMASLEEMEMSTERGIDAATVSQLGTGAFVRDGNTVIVCGPAETGKTYLAMALGNVLAGWGTTWHTSICKSSWKGLNWKDCRAMKSSFLRKSPTLIY